MTSSPLFVLNPSCPPLVGVQGVDWTSSPLQIPLPYEYEFSSRILRLAHSSLHSVLLSKQTYGYSDKNPPDPLVGPPPPLYPPASGGQWLGTSPVTFVLL